MGALSIAFDTIIVGALALPWLVFAVDLFFLQDHDDDRRAFGVLAHLQKEAKIQPAAAAVILFAVAYLLGSAVARTAQDFFNDNDLMGISLTEDNIRTAEYCAQDSEIRRVFQKDGAFGELDKVDCAPTIPTEGRKQWKWWICKRVFGNFCDERSDEVVSETQAVFQVQEGALLLNGQDKTERLRQFHDQIMVLRGAAFDGVLASILCLFACCAKKRVRIRRALAFVPGFFFVLGLYSLSHHFQTKDINDAPFMEITVILLGAGGFVALWRGEQRRWYGLGLFVPLLLLTCVAYLGWWRTEVLYDRQVIYSFFAQSYPPLR
jgi:hypothetical protein